MNKNKLISQIVNDYIEDNGLSNRRLAKEINEQIGVDNAIGYQAIRYWRVGETKPLPGLIEILYLSAEDESMKKFARDILEVIKPKEYAVV